MFEGISFLNIKTDRPITSRQVTEEALKSGKYDSENLRNSDFSIYGSAESFPAIPISDFAKSNLLYMQSFTIFNYKKGSYTRRSNFRSYLVLYTYDGVGEVEYLERTHRLGAGEGIIIDCKKPHYYEAVSDWRVGVLHIDGPLAEYYCDEYHRNERPVFFEEINGRFHRYIEKILDVYNSPTPYRDLRAHHAINSMLLYLTILSSNLSIHKKDLPHHVQSAMKYIEEHYSEDVSLDILASVAKINKFYLSKEYKRYTGFSPHDYLIWLRINHAKVMLTTTDMPASKIAHTVGIHDINNFNYLFKKRVGMTPIQYRTSLDYIL